MPYQIILFIFEDAFVGDVLNAKQDCGVCPLLIEDFASIQNHCTSAEAGKIVLDLVVFHHSLLGNDFSKQQTKLRNIPLTVSEVI